MALMGHPLGARLGPHFFWVNHRRLSPLGVHGGWNKAKNARLQVALWQNSITTSQLVLALAYVQSGSHGQYQGYAHVYIYIYIYICVCMCVCAYDLCDVRQ